MEEEQGFAQTKIQKKQGQKKEQKFKKSLKGTKMCTRLAIEQE